MKKPEWTKVYNLPSIKGEGWARVILTSDGMFSTVSDWGNYAFWWGAIGPEDFREFVIQLVGQTHYVCSKFCHHPYPYDGEATYKAVKRHILESRRRAEMTQQEARDEWYLLEKNSDLDTVVDFTRWHDETELCDAHEFAVYSPPGDAVGFCEHILPRLAELLKAELKAERQATAPQQETSHAS